MSGRRIGAITRRLLQGFRRDRRTLALLFVAPIVILSLLGYLIRGSTSSPAVGIANEDQGPLGATVASALASSSKIATSSIHAADGDAKLKDGTLVAYIVFSSDFSARAQQGIIAPEVHVEGSQPGTAGPVLQALQQALVSAISQASGRTLSVQPKVTYLYGGLGFDTLDYFGAAFIGIIVFFLVFVVTIVSFLNERTQGTLERLMASPLRRGEIVLGYMLGFTVLALVQSAEVLAFSLAVLKIHNAGNVALIFTIEALMAIAAVNLGIFLSMFARTEFQAVQFIPLVIVPQLLLSGILFPVSSEPKPLQLLSNVLPLTYAVNGLRDVMVKGADLSWASLQLDVGVVFGFVILVLVAGATTLRRRIA
jgi:ABC-2 type transport system permease protein